MTVATARAIRDLGHDLGLNPWKTTIYVNSAHSKASDSGSAGSDPKYPLATIAQALVILRTYGGDNYGHEIIVGAGHVETIDAADDLDFNVTGLTVTGIGKGATQPQLRFNTVVGANVVVSGNDVTLTNLKFQVGITSLTKLASITGNDVTLRNCVCDDGGLILVDGLVCTGADLLIDGCNMRAPTAGNQSLIQLTGTARPVITGCTLLGDAEAGVIENVTTLATRVLIQDCFVEAANAAARGIVMMATATGSIDNVRSELAAAANAGTWITAGGCIVTNCSPQPGSRVTLYVSSTHALKTDTNNNGRDPSRPLATIKQAMVLVRLLGGTEPVIDVARSHVETIIDAAGIAFDVAGLTVIGHGSAKDKPNFNFTTNTAANITVTADNVTFRNLKFTCGITNQVNMVAVTGDSFSMLDCRLTDGGVVVIDPIIATAGDDVLIDNLYATCPTAGNQSIVQLVGCAHPIVRNCFLRGDAQAGAIESVNTLSTDVLIDNNWLQSTHVDDVVIVMHANTTGWITNDKMRLATDGQLSWITAAKCQLINNYGVNADAETGLLAGAVSA